MFLRRLCATLIFALFENLAKKLNVVTSAPAPVASAAPTSAVGASASVVGAGAAALAAAATVRPSKRCAKKEKVVRMATATEVDVDTECINAIRFLAVDAVNKANSGHPGAPMGQAPIGYLLFAEEMQYNPEDPKWVNRDRFVLSSGHGCMLQYSLLHLAGYKSVSIDDIKQFRQWGSKTPGHPENFETEGIEVHLGRMLNLQTNASFLNPFICLIIFDHVRSCLISFNSMLILASLFQSLKGISPV